MTDHDISEAAGMNANAVAVAHCPRCGKAILVDALIRRVECERERGLVVEFQDTYMTHLCGQP